MISPLRPNHVNNVRSIVDELRDTKDWPMIELDAPLLLFDVLEAIEASPAQIAAVLGADAIEYIGAVTARALWPRPEAQARAEQPGAEDER